MLESVSLDQLRMFVAAADTGSFSAAARQFRRAQSALSQAISALEGSLGVRLFDRSGRLPKLTQEGVALLATAREVVSRTDMLKCHARNIAGGLEPELSIVLDTMFPQSTLSDALKTWTAQFPQTPLRVYFEALGGVPQAVLDGRCSIGVIGTKPTPVPMLEKEWLFSVPIVTVVAPSHPLAVVRGVIGAEAAERHVQIVLTDRSLLTAGTDFGVIAPRNWLVADLSTKQHFLCAGLGWGNMPLPAVADDIARGKLVEIKVEGGPMGVQMQMSAIYRSDARPGRAGRWLIDRLKSLSAEGPRGSSPGDAVLPQQTGAKLRTRPRRVRGTRFGRRKDLQRPD